MQNPLSNPRTPGNLQPIPQTLQPGDWPQCSSYGTTHPDKTLFQIILETLQNPIINPTKPQRRPKREAPEVQLGRCVKKCALGALAGTCRVTAGFGLQADGCSTVSPIKLETGLRPNSAGIPYTLLLRIQAIGFPTFGLLLLTGSDDNALRGILYNNYTKEALEKSW